MWEIVEIIIENFPLILLIAIVLGFFEACCNEAKKAEQFYKEQRENERAADEAATVKESEEK